MSDTTSINPDDFARIISDDSNNQADDVGERRLSDRYSYYKIIGLLVAIQDGPAPSYLRVGSRNISCHGMCFLHDRPLAEGTHCAAYLLTIQGDYVKTTGNVTRCDCLPEGVCEIGLEFENSLEIDRFSFMGTPENIPAD